MFNTETPPPDVRRSHRLGATNTQALPQPLVFTYGSHGGAGCSAPPAPASAHPFRQPVSCCPSGCLVAKERMLLVTLGGAVMFTLPGVDQHLGRDRSLRGPRDRDHGGPRSQAPPTRCTPRVPGSPSRHGNWPWYPCSLTQGALCACHQAALTLKMGMPKHLYSISSSLLLMPIVSH